MLVCFHAHVYVRTPMHVCTSSRAYVHTCIHAGMCSRMYMINESLFPFMCMRTFPPRMHTCAHAFSHAPSRIHPVVHICTQIHTCTHVHVRTRTMQASVLSRIRASREHLCSHAQMPTASHAHMRTCTHSRACACACAHAPLLRCTFTHSHTNTRPPSHLYGRAHAHLRAWSRAWAHAPHSQSRTLTRARVSMHPCIHARVHARPCTYMLTRTLLHLRSRSFLHSAHPRRHSHTQAPLQAAV